MNVASLPRKVVRGLPYLGKEIRAVISDKTPLFVAVPRTVHIWRGAPCNAKCIMCTYSWFKGDAYRSLVNSPFKDEMMPQALKEIHELCGRGTLVSYMGGSRPPAATSPIGSSRRGDWGWIFGSPQTATS